MQKTVLLVPGFVADTYSEIEKSFVELCARPDSRVRFIWLVPTISFRGTRVGRPESKTNLREPIYVTELREARIPCIVGNIHKANVWSNFFLFKRLFHEHQIDAVYAHFGFERFWAFFFGKLWRKTTIWNAHWDSLGTRFVFAKKVFYRLFVDYFISVSGFITGTLPKPDRTYTIPNSIRLGIEDPKTATTRKSVCRDQLQLPSSAPVVLMVAAFTKQKRHRCALTIALEILKSRKDAVFVFLGDGPERNRIISEIESSDWSSHFVIPGHVCNTKDYYLAADLCMFTGFNDAAPYAVLEAMAHALPVVAFKSGGPAEVIRNEETGCLIDEGDTRGYVDAIARLLDDSSMRLRMGRAGLYLIRNRYSRDVWIADVLTALAEMIKTGDLREEYGVDRRYG